MVALLLGIGGFLWLPQWLGEGQLARANDDGGGQPLACIGQSTFFPRGIRWSIQAGSALTVRLQKDGPANQNSPIDIPASVANAAAYAGFSTWMATRCANPVGSPPFLAIQRGPDYAHRNNGDSPASNIYTSVVWWVVDPTLWQADSTTVAVTTSSYFADTGFLVDSDIAFNGINFQWRATDASNALYGCNAANANCFDIASVAIHEVGHFLGFNHVSCAGAVMAPQANNASIQGLSAHEKAGICALYAPNTSSSSGISSLGGQCADATECSDSLSCLLPANVATGASLGVCSKPCSASTDCPVAYVCSSIGTQGRFCTPGVHLAGVPVQSATAVGDLCLACQSGGSCISGICGIIGGIGICTQSCTAPAYACPDGFACTAASANLNLCWPIEPDQCAATYVGQPLNAVCKASATSADPKSGIVAPCKAGLTCFGFSSGIGECVGACSSVDSSQACDPGFSCCLNVDAKGHCLISNPSATTGGCFKIRHAGDSCVQANQAICDPTTQCLYTEDPTLSQCYHLCPNKQCADPAETCVASPSGTGVCCQSSTYNPSDFSTCVAHPGHCPRQVGVGCSQNSDCESLNCLKYAGAAACSISCQTDTDCPGAAVDVNEDGVPDGGSHCIAVGSGSMCWPVKGPVALPACATDPNAGPGVVAAGGCGGCAQGRTQPSELVLYLVLGAAVYRCFSRFRAGRRPPVL
jgi:hypothetical protein